MKGCTYIETGSHFEEENDLVEIRGEVDRIYLSGEQSSPLILESLGKRVEIESSGFNETVVWNPWIEGAVSISDMSNCDYLKMICVESVIAAGKIELEPKESWSGTQFLKSNYIV